MTAIIIPVIFIVVSVGITIFSVIKFRKLGVKQMLEEGQKMLDENQEAIKQMHEHIKKMGYDPADVEAGKVVCQYCGAMIEKDTYKCPNCGATKK
ncbi:MAG: hypothetical protein IJA69_04675 [Clostridia bacterium]|nr:hypothetical protein [Clostridia bacterium]